MNTKSRTVDEENEKPQAIHDEKSSQKFLLPPLSPKLLKPFLSIAGFVLIAGSIGLSIYFYNQYKSTQALLKNPTQASSTEVKSVLAKLATIMELPTEAPQVATVVDKAKLMDQPFFQNAMNGDKVVIYSKTGEAILYRPMTNKIIEVAPLTKPTAAAQEQGNVAGASTIASVSPTITPAVVSPAKAEKVSVVVYNGTVTQGLAAKIQQKITQKFPSYTVSLGNTVIKSYKGVTVYSLKGHDAEAQSLAKALNATVEKNIQEGEVAPNADILVIAGQ